MYLIGSQILPCSHISLLYTAGGGVLCSSAGCSDPERGDDVELERAARLDVGQQRRQSDPRLRALSPAPSLGRLGRAPAERRQPVARRLQPALRLRLLVLPARVQPARRRTRQSRPARRHQRLRLCIARSDHDANTDTDTDRHPRRHRPVDRREDVRVGVGVGVGVVKFQLMRANTFGGLRWRSGGGRRRLT